MLSRLLLYAVLFFSPAIIKAQQSLCDIKFARAVQAVSDGKLRVILLVRPIQPEDYPPVVSTKVLYSFDNETEKKTDIMRKDDHINLTVYGKNVKEKSLEISQLVEGQTDPENHEEVSIFVFTFFNLPSKKIDTMSMTYGFWEKREQNVRVEKKYVFKVE